MKQLKDEMSYFLRQKIFVTLLAITAVCCYGFAISHESVGMDDTVVAVYLEDGLAVIIGRWTMYLLNRLFHISEFAPFITEFLGVLFLLMAVILFCVLFRRICGDKIGIWGYTAFSCMFVSQPFISEVYVYYFHNGVDIGYILLALSLIFLLDALDKKGKNCLKYLLGSFLFLWVAVGCYESFLILYIVGILVILFFRGMMDREKLTYKRLFQIFGICVCMTVCCILLRALMQKFMTLVFSLQNEKFGFRDVTYSAGFLADENWLENTFMLMKRYWLIYCANAVVYFPIMVYVLSVAVFGAASIVLSFRKRNMWYPMLFLGMVIAPFLLTFVEVKPPLYRTCQFMPFFIASAVFILYRFCAQIYWKRLGSVLFGLIVTVLVWNQAYEMNWNFYTDYKRYEYEKRILINISREVTGSYGQDVTVIFTGSYTLPSVLLDHYYAEYSSEAFDRISRVTDWLDPHLKEKYYTPYGYSFGGEANSSLIEWGLYAFDGPGSELVHFLQMHGYAMRTVTDEMLIQRAEEFAEELPRWPEKGSISEMDEYVVVHF